jgi:hypothetical protein
MKDETVKRKRSSSDIPPHMASVNPALGNLTREQVAHGEARAPRVSMNTGEFLLAVPDGTIPEGKVGHWFLDDGRGRIDRAKAAWWEHVTDMHGNNWTAQSGPSKMYLMAIDKIYYDEDENLREQNYRASLGKRDDESLGVPGLESYTPSGADNKIRINSDPFA